MNDADMSKLSASVEVVRMVSQQAKEISAELRQDLKNHIKHEDTDIKSLVAAIHQLDMTSQSLANSVSQLIETVSGHNERLTVLERAKIMVTGGWLGITIMVSAIWAAGTAALKYFGGS